MSSAWRDRVRMSWPMDSMELDFDVEVLEAAQPHGGSYLGLVFTFVKSRRKIYRGSIFFLFHGNGGRSSRVQVLVHAIVASAWHLGRYFLFQGGFLGGEWTTQDHGPCETDTVSTDASALATPFVRGSGYSRAPEAGRIAGCGNCGLSGLGHWSCRWVDTGWKVTLASVLSLPCCARLRFCTRSATSVVAASELTLFLNENANGSVQREGQSRGARDSYMV